MCIPVLVPVTSDKNWCVKIRQLAVGIPKAVRRVLVFSWGVLCVVLVWLPYTGFRAYRPAHGV